MNLINSFEKYSAKVFHLIQSLSLLKDTRKNPKIGIKDIVWGYFLGSTLRMKATSTIEEEIRHGVLKKRVRKKISDDTFGYGLDHLEPESLQEFWHELAKRIKRNGMLRNSPFNDYIVGVLDGIEVFSSYNRECDNCLTRKVTKKEPVKKRSKNKDRKKDKVNKKEPDKKKKVKTIQYYHKAVVLILAGYDFPISLGLEMMRKGEDEVNCALRLLKRIVNNLGVRFLDIVICDALYCTPNFFRECQKLGIKAGAVLKGNQENLLESALAQKKIIEPVIIKKGAKEELKLWDFKSVFWETADKDVRVIWADRKVLEKKKEKKKDKDKEKKKKTEQKGSASQDESGHSPNMQITQMKPATKATKVNKVTKTTQATQATPATTTATPATPATTTATTATPTTSDNSDDSDMWIDKKNVFAFSSDIQLPTKVVYAIGRHRWDIDVRMFMDMTQNWHLKHKTLHFKNAYVNMLSIKLISHMLFSFFFYRHINSRKREKIKSYITMVRKLYRDACINLEPEFNLLE